MSMAPASPSPGCILDSPSATSHKRKRDSDESGSEELSSSEEEDLDETHKNDQEIRDYTSRRSICQLEDLLEEMKTLPESSERNMNIEELEKFTKALDSYDFESCRKYQKCIDQNDLENILETAGGEFCIEEMIRSCLKHAESKPPKNEDVARALSCFTGSSGEAEIKKLVAAVTNNMCALGEINNEDVLRRNAEPWIIDLVIGWNSKEDETRAGLVKLFKFKPVFW